MFHIEATEYSGHDAAKLAQFFPHGEFSLAVAAWFKQRPARRTLNGMRGRLYILCP